MNYRGVGPFSMMIRLGWVGGLRKNGCCLGPVASMLENLLFQIMKPLVKRLNLLSLVLKLVVQIGDK